MRQIADDKATAERARRNIVLVLDVRGVSPEIDDVFALHDIAAHRTAQSDVLLETPRVVVFGAVRAESLFDRLPAVIAGKVARVVRCPRRFGTCVERPRRRPRRTARGMSRR